MNLDAFEAAQGGRFWYRWHSGDFTLPTPAMLGHQALLVVLHDGLVPGIPCSEVDGVPMPYWAAQRLFERWAAHYDLPSYGEAQRLCYALDHHGKAAEYDIRVATGEDVGELWRARRWRYLLNLIDHLPPNTWFSEALANDEEYAKVVAEAQARRAGKGDEEESGPTRPPLRTWSPEVAMLATLVNEVRRNTYVLQAINSDKGKGPSLPEPVPTPETALARAQRAAIHKERKSRHEALARRLVPHRYADGAE